MKSKRTRIAGIGACLLATVAVSPVRGQDADSAAQDLDLIPVDTTGDASAAAGPDKVVRNRVIEEIIVTAQKREENIQNVPISIQAFSGDALAARGIGDTTQLAQSVAGLQFTSIGGFTMVYIRGLGTDNYVPSADPSIATYIDGVYVPQGQSISTSLGNVERVEVLKGPQGTLFGRNATGGAISVITADPGDSFETSLEAESGNFSARSAKLNASLPLTSWLSAGLSGLYSRQDSYYENTNYELQTSSLSAARLKLRFQPSDDLTLVLAGYYAKQSGVGTMISENTQPSLIGSIAGIRARPDDYKTASDYLTYGATRQEIVYGHLTWRLPWLDMKLLGNGTRFSGDLTSLDFDGSYMPLVGFYTDGAFTNMQTAEWQLVSNDDTPFADRFKWVFGLYYLHSEAGFDPLSLAVAPRAIQSAAQIVGLSIPTGLQRLIDFLPVDNTSLDAGETVLSSGLLGTKSYSAYVQGTYTFTDWLDLTLGGRFQYEDRYMTKSVTAVELPFNDTAVNILPFPLPGEKEKNFSPKAVLGFHLDDSKLIYLSYSVGFKSGTYNVVNIYTAPNYIVPEEVRSYELGGKMDFLNGDLRVNAAVFNNRIKNLQSGFVSLLSGGAVRFLTVPSARTRGADFDGTLVPLPSRNPGLALTANLAYIDATYTDFPDGSGFGEGTGLYRTGLDLSGNRIVRTPKWSGGLGLVQTINVANGSIEIAIDEYYNSGFYYDAYNSVEENPYAILNARVGYRYDPWNLRVTAYGKNLLDRRYHNTKLQTDFGIATTLAPPVEYGLRIDWEF